MKITAMVQTHSKTLARGAELRGGSSRIVGRGCEANLGGGGYDGSIRRARDTELPGAICQAA